MVVVVRSFYSSVSSTLLTVKTLSICTLCNVSTKGIVIVPSCTTSQIDDRNSKSVNVSKTQIPTKAYDKLVLGGKT